MFSSAAGGITLSTSGCGGGRKYANQLGGVLWSPNFPSNYGNSQNCNWLISSQVNLTVTVREINTESCCDHLYIYDGGSTSAPLIGKYSGKSIPPQATSTTNQLYLRFKSDGSVVKTGFSAQFEGNRPVSDD